MPATNTTVELYAGPKTTSIPHEELDGCGADRIWRAYVKESNKYDIEQVEGWNRSLDATLIFSALFSAICTMFLVDILKLPNKSESVAPILPKPASSVELYVNVLWFISLSLSVAVSMISMLAKEWCYGIMSSRIGDSFDVMALSQWRWHPRWTKREWIMKIIIFLPSLIHLSFLSFSVGLSIYLWNQTPSVTIAVIFAILIFTLIWVIASPFPLHSILDTIYSRSRKASIPRFVQPLVMKRNKKGVVHDSEKNSYIAAMEHGRLQIQGVLHASRTTLICNTTPLEEIMSFLVDHGCRDLTSCVPTDGAPTRAHAHGGACDVYKWKANLDSSRSVITVPVAIKVLRCSGDSNIETRLPKRAAKELTTWLQLDHPNILPLLGFAVFRDGLSMVSPWMSEGNLGVYLRKNNSSNADRIDFCKQILVGLIYIHKKNMVHGDLKPMNIMVSPKGTAMIADFGNSVLKDMALSFAPTTTFTMTRQFAPPEHLTAEYMPVATKQSDVYSYGMTVLEVLTGKTPFAGKNDTWLAIQASKQRLLPSKPSTIDNSIWSMLCSCWAHDPSDRPAVSDIYFP